MALISVNGKTYDSGDVMIAMFGSIDYEVTQIAYSKSQEHTHNYSLGSNDPSSYSAGKVKPEGSITLRIPSAGAIEKAAGGDLLRIKPFPIIVSYINDDNEPIVDKVVAKFAKQGRDVGGDSDLKYQYDLFVLKVDFNKSL